MENKVCPKCGRSLPLSEFHFIVGKPVFCKDCKNLYRNNQRKYTKETVKEQRKVIRKLESKIKANERKLEEYDLILKDSKKDKKRLNKVLSDILILMPEYVAGNGNIYKCTDCGCFFQSKVKALRCEKCRRTHKLEEWKIRSKSEEGKAKRKEYLQREDVKKRRSEYQKSRTRTEEEKEKARQRNIQLPDNMVIARLKAKGFTDEQINPDVVETERALIKFRRMIRSRQKEEGTFYTQKQNRNGN